MHVLIIPGEELNESNQYSSVFELHQALALQKQNIHVGFISIALKGNLYNSIKNIFLFKKNAIANFKNLQKKSTISFQTIEGFNVVEATNSYKLPGFFRMRYYEQVQSGLKAYNKYVKKFGSPNIIHAHSRFLTGGIIAKAIKGKYGIPYVLTEHSTFYARNLLTLEDKKQIQSVINNATQWICVSPQLGNLVTAMVTGLNKTFEYVPNVVDPMFENIIPNKLTLTSEPFAFINIASLDEKKAQSLLIEAFAKQFPNSKKMYFIYSGYRAIGKRTKKVGCKKRIEWSGIFFRSFKQKRNLNLFAKMPRICFIEYLRNFWCCINRSFGLW